MSTSGCLFPNNGIFPTTPPVVDRSNPTYGTSPYVQYGDIITISSGAQKFIGEDTANPCYLDTTGISSAYLFVIYDASDISHTGPVNIGDSIFLYLIEDLGGQHQAYSNCSNSYNSGSNCDYWLLAAADDASVENTDSTLQLLNGGNSTYSPPTESSPWDNGSIEFVLNAYNGSSGQIAYGITQFYISDFNGNPLTFPQTKGSEVGDFWWCDFGCSGSPFSFYTSAGLTPPGVTGCNPPACDPGVTTCFNGTCVPTAGTTGCTGTFCSGGQLCSGGACIPCSTSTPCPVGYNCNNGSCVQTTTPSSSNKYLYIALGVVGFIILLIVIILIISSSSKKKGGNAPSGYPYPPPPGYYGPR